MVTDVFGYVFDDSPVTREVSLGSCLAKDEPVVGTVAG